ncbi:MAG: hypothetical protein IKO55_09555 [Kiritimatiellae bacterium]|nr:hypothetical protein [Kiritimatiellia bacterium]
MPQRDNAIEEIKRLDALLEYAVEHNDTAEAERLAAATFRTSGVFVRFGVASDKRSCRQTPYPPVRS